MSLDLESGFDAEELDCGGDGVTTAGKVVVLVEAETANGWYRSTVVGSDGVWKVTRLVP